MATVCDICDKPAIYFLSVRRGADLNTAYPDYCEECYNSIQGMIADERERHKSIKPHVVVAPPTVNKEVEKEAAVEKPRKRPQKPLLI